MAAQIVYDRSGCPRCHRNGGESEDRVRRVVEQVTGWKFPKAHPTWLRGRSSQLELDGYNARHRVAFEYQGEQHYHAQRFGAAALAANRRRDERKRLLCYRHGVLLIRVPYWKQDVKQFVRSKLANLRLHASAP